jgi:hypothetical protein
MRSLLLLLGFLALFAGASSAADLPAGPSFTNSLGMNMARIEHGTFLMGSVKGGDFDERPVHKVAMHTYRISVREDGVAQIYRDGQILSLRPGDESSGPLFKGGRTYLQWGEGAASSEADALIAGVAYDLAGPFQPEEQSHP